MGEEINPTKAPSLLSRPPAYATSFAKRMGGM